MYEIIRKSLDEYYGCIEDDINGRYRSWEHCYSVFGKLKDRDDDVTLDYLSLNLGFYLASWGMYRGSSFLLQKDYKIHSKAVRIMKEDRFKCLYGISIEKLLEPETFSLFQELISELKSYYDVQRKSVKDCKSEFSKTLITKILLGVFGCVPAFDRFFCGAVRKYNVCSTSITNINTYKNLGIFYNKYKKVIEKKREEINKAGIIYPQMKMLDIIFWQIGFDEGL